MNIEREQHVGSDSKSIQPSGQWVHVWAWTVAFTIFPLIWVGGLVTTQDAGMAVPDWPGTYGYNMFAYPISAWVYGPFDLLVEHGHRLLGSLAGLLVIGLCIAAWRSEPRRWVRQLCLWLLVAITAQGLLGGARVLLDARTLAMIHGCTGPLVFALAASIVTVTSYWWKQDDKSFVSRGWLAWMTILLVISAVSQLALGAQLRHIQAWATPSFFTSLVHTHLLMAALVLMLVIVILATSWSAKYRSMERIRGLRWMILGLLTLQIFLGCGTWIANYALPWSESHPILSRYTIAIHGYWESWIITGHQATGSLIIVASVVFALRVWRAKLGPFRQSHRNSILNHFILWPSTFPMSSPDISIPTAPTLASSTAVVSSATSSLVANKQLSWWQDYMALTKPRILMMILLTVGIGLVAFAHRQLSLIVAINTLLGTTLIAASASVLNQWFEADQDALMTRTKNRPLPAGRLTNFEAALFGWTIGAIGFTYLAIATNWMATCVGLTTWIAYVWIYTPMKQWSWWNTAVGTLPGALPVMIGWAAAGGSIYDWEGWIITSVVILWQFPHFMAIAWLYRDQYAGAGYKMLTNVEPTGLAAGWHAVIPAIVLIPASILAVTPEGPVSWCLAVLAVASCLSQLAASVRFLRDRNQQTARKLLHSSLIYLPSILLIVMVRSLL